jgi:hypothetical protein
MFEKLIFTFTLTTGLCLAQAPDFEMTINASLDPMDWKIEGEAKVTIHEAGTEATLLLQPNAYANIEALRKSGIAVPAQVLEDGARYLGYMDIREVRMADGSEPAGPVVINGTEMKIPLAGTADLVIRFVVKLPHRTLARCGYIGQHVDASLWFPKPRGAGNFDVTLSMPEHFIVEATGNLEESHVENSIKRVRYKSEGLSDFAWTADPNYIVEQNLYKGVEIVVLSQPFMEKKVPSLLEAAKGCIDFAEGRLAPYTHGKMVVASTPYGAGRDMAHPMFISIGQEFPTHLNCFVEHAAEPEIRLLRAWANQYVLDVLGEDLDSPIQLGRSLATYIYLQMLPVLVSEKGALSGLEKMVFRDLLNSGFGLHPRHQSEGVCCAPYRAHLQWLNVISLVGFRTSPFHPDFPKPTLMGYEMPEFAGHWTTLKRAYTRDGLIHARGALALMTLENHIGGEKMKNILVSFVTRGGAGKASVDDFLQAVLEGAGEAEASMAGELLREGCVIDFAVDEVLCTPEIQSFGYVTPENPGDNVEANLNAPEKHLVPGLEELVRWERKRKTTESPVNGDWRWKVTVSNRGNAALPVTVLLTFESGRTETRDWDGNEAHLHLQGTGEDRLLSAVVDPDVLYALDLDRLNNARCVEFKRNGVLFLAAWTQFWVQNFLNGWAFFN